MTRVIVPIIKVDENGLDADGFDYTYAATPEGLDRGIVAEREVVLQYPDGRKVRSVEVLITKKGVQEFLSAQS